MLVLPQKISTIPTKDHIFIAFFHYSYESPMMQMMPVIQEQKKLDTSDPGRWLVRETNGQTYLHHSHPIGLSSHSQLYLKINGDLSSYWVVWSSYVERFATRVHQTQCGWRCHCCWSRILVCFLLIRGLKSWRGGQTKLPRPAPAELESTDSKKTQNCALEWWRHWWRKRIEADSDPNA